MSGGLAPVFSMTKQLTSLNFAPNSTFDPIIHFREYIKRVWRNAFVYNAQIIVYYHEFEGKNHEYALFKLSLKVC